MAEGDGFIYNKFKFELLNGVFNLASGGHTLQGTLHTSYTPNIDTHTVWADTGVSSTEYGTSGGYTAGGKVLANQTTAMNTTNDRGEFNADDLTWTSLTLSPATPGHFLMWNNTPTSPADPLMAYWELGTTATNGGDYTLQFGATIINAT